jgi:hypothetical protein
MEAVIHISKVENIVVAKLQHSRVPLSIGMIQECPDLKDAKFEQIRDLLRRMKERGQVRAVPVVNPGRKDRIGYEYVHGQTIARPPLPEPVKKILDEVRLKINDDHSVTITTPKIRVTIEVPL